jgi:phosphate transport system ATP-binding protein
MDESCSALDPITTRKIEDLMQELKKRFAIAIVTHNLQQAKRVADKTALLFVGTRHRSRTGYLVEYGDTQQIFDDPKEKPTQDYIRGEFSCGLNQSGTKTQRKTTEKNVR